MLLLLTGALVTAAMTLAMAMPAFAFHTEGHTGGSGGNCPLTTDPDAGACSGGGGGIQPYGCDTVTGECTDYAAGGGGHNTYETDPFPGDQTSSGGGGGQVAVEPGSEVDPGGGGGSGHHCEYDASGEGGCVGGGSAVQPGG
jgi:hypothetical protein